MAAITVDETETLEIKESLNEKYGLEFAPLFIEAVTHALTLSKYTFLPKKEQMEAMLQLSKGNDVFVKLRTGFGKSLIYTLFPFVCDFFRGCSTSIVVLISPLVSLMEDQIQSLKDKGIPAAKLSETLHRDVLKHKILLLSPESFENKEVRCKLKDLKENVVCVAVDEAHCIEQWGREFRGAYDQLNEVRALLLPKVPLIALTATANARVMQYIINKLDMENCHVVNSSSNRGNIFYEVQLLQKYDDDDELLEQCFGHIADHILKDRVNAQKTLIFCKSTNDCATVFEYFEGRLGQNIKQNNELCVNMYVKITDEETKKHILQTFTDSRGLLRVVICTSAFGMGVDCPNVREIIHFFSPSSLMQYSQESGRAGRDGQSSKVILLYSGREFGHYKAQLTKSSASRVQFNELEIMKGYCQNTTMCRRLLLLKYLDSAKEAKQCCSKLIKHQCCDICAVSCKCSSCTSSKAMTSFVGTFQEASISKATTSESMEVGFSEKDKEFIFENLKKYQQSLGSDLMDTIFSRDSTTGFTNVVIDQVVLHCEKLFTVENVYEFIDVWFEEHATAILDVLSRCSVR